MVRIAITACLLIICGTTASACTPVGGIGYFVLAKLSGNAPINVNADCSFDRAGKALNKLGEGGASKANGKGLVSQVVRFGEGCAIHEYLIVTDCNSGQALLIKGPKYPYGGGSSVIDSAEVLLKPHGPLNLERERSLEAIAAKARSAGALATSDASTFIASLRKKDRFDPLCGCKLFYPDSEGAKK